MKKQKYPRSLWNVALPICLTFRARSAKSSVCPHPNFAGNGTIFLDSVQELRELIYNVPLDKDRRNDRPLSKLTQDILEEIENL